MATPTVRQVVSASNSAGSATVTTGAGTAVSDLLVVFYGGNYYQLSGMGAPSGTAGTWTLRTTADAGTNEPHIKVYTRPVTVAGAQTVTVPANSDSEVYQFCYVVAGAASTMAAGAAAGNASATATTAQVAPSVTAEGADDLLLCAWQDGSAPVNYSAPGGMTNLLEEETAGFSTLATARQVLGASGATGTRTATSSLSRVYAAASIAIKGAAGGPATVTGAAALSASGTLTASATVTTTVPGSAALSASGSLAATGLQNTSAGAALSGSGTLAAAGTRVVLASAALAASGTLTATPLGGAVGAAALSASGSLTAAGLQIVRAAAALSASGSLTAAPLGGVVVGAAALQASAGLTAVGARGLLAAAALSASGTLTASGLLAVPVSDVRVTRLYGGWAAAAPSPGWPSEGPGGGWSVDEPERGWLSREPGGGWPVDEPH